MTSPFRTFLLTACVAICCASKNLRGPGDIPQTKIVGGTDASLNDFPFFVNLGGCGGSLIWEDSKYLRQGLSFLLLLP